ncbi:MAG TPA: glycosyltransferase family 39 protein, partial [Bacteroidia bacterium]|nr:glycosyltransferase family 39 protein [Bacteroidia bacterium]
MSRSKIYYPALLILFWVVTLVIVYPIGNFPLDDDWQYGRPVWAMISEGHYASTDSYSPVLIAQAFWGLLFCLPFGFSFTSLRISTLVLSLFGVILFYYLLLRVSKNQKMSFLGALLLAANPLYIILSCTFMTDIPFLALAILCVYFFFKAIDSDKARPVVLATFFSMLAVLIRQFGVVIPLAYAVVMIFKNRPKIAKCIIYFIPTVITAITLEAGLLWLKYIGAELKPYRNVPISDFLKKPIAMFSHSIDWGSHIFTYSGFFLLPLLAYVTWDVVKPMSKRRKIVMASFIAVLSPVIILCCLKVFSGNIISTYGIGPRTLKGFDDIVYPNPDFPLVFLVLLQLIAFCGAVMFLINMGKLMMDIIEAYMHKSFNKAMYKQIYILLF